MDTAELARLFSQQKGGLFKAKLKEPPKGLQVYPHSTEEEWTRDGLGYGTVSFSRSPFSSAFYSVSLGILAYAVLAVFRCNLSEASRSGPLRTCFSVVFDGRTGKMLEAATTVVAALHRRGVLTSLHMSVQGKRCPHCCVQVAEPMPDGALKLV